MVCQKLCQNHVSGWRSLEESNFVIAIVTGCSFSHTFGPGRGECLCRASPVHCPRRPRHQTFFCVRAATDNLRQVMPGLCCVGSPSFDANQALRSLHGLRKDLEPFGHVQIDNDWRAYQRMSLHYIYIYICLMLFTDFRRQRVIWAFLEDRFELPLLSISLFQCFATGRQGLAVRLTGESDHKVGGFVEQHHHIFNGYS